MGKLETSDIHLFSWPSASFDYGQKGLEVIHKMDGMTCCIQHMGFVSLLYLKLNSQILGWDAN